MPSFRIAFPSKFVKAEDLGTARLIGTIARVGFEEIGSGPRTDNKLVVHFEEAALKPLILNLINADTIAEIAGDDDFERWPGTRICLFATKTEFQGKRVDCIRLCAPPKPRPAGRAAATLPVDAPPAETGADDVF